MVRIFMLTVAIILVSQSFIQAQKNKKEVTKDTVFAEIIKGLKFRSLGPAMTSGRIADFAVNPDNSSEYYIGAASGNIWKTVNNGTTFKPVFDDYGAYSIGCLKMDPKNHNVVWAGTGENNHQRALGYGDGIYKTVDGGKSWKNMGLKKSYHIGMIAIHPDNTDIVYAAAEGSTWGDNDERGLYKTADGGKTWNKVFFISKNTGVNNVLLHPKDPEIVFVTSEQRRRRVNTNIGGGPESAFYKSVDGGKTFRKITTGLPDEHIGGMGIAIAPSDPDVMYLIVEAANDAGGFFRSQDQGETWEKMSSYYASGQYYNEIYCDPLDKDRVYSVDTYSRYTEDGGKTWHKLSTVSRHVDDHAMWIDPGATDHFMIGSDGGLYETYDRGKTWLYKCNLPVTQFYRVATDNDYPFYNVYGGTQDNNTLGGPSRTQSSFGITNEDWKATLGGDGFWPAADPENPNIVYSEYQYGNLYRIDKTSGEKQYIKPMPEKDELTFKWNWNAPFIISPHSNKRLYIAANKVFRSDDMGNSWKKISDDLTAKVDRDKWPVMDRYWSSDAVVKDVSTSLYGTIVSIDESTVKENLVYIGADDGNIQVTEDAATWRKIERPAEVPEFTYISDIKASDHNESVVFAAFDNRKRNDLKPYLFISEDKGATWKSISAGLPVNGAVHCIEQDHANADLLFVGTEFGIFFSYNKGVSWFQLKSGLPTISVRDIELHKRENDVVIATFGRGIYVLDDYTPLRELDGSFKDKEAHFFPVKDAIKFKEEGGKYGQGSSFFRAKNPDYGAVFTYYLKEAPKTSKKERHEKEKELFKEKKKIIHPTTEELRLEKLEENPFLLFTIRDSLNNIVRKLSKPAEKGISRLTWNLDHTGYYSIPKDSSINICDGFKVVPGTYTVSMELVQKGETKILSESVPFRVKALGDREVEAEKNDILAKHLDDLHKLAGNFNSITQYLSELEKRSDHVNKAVLLAKESNPELIKEMISVKKELSDIRFQLFGTPAKASWEEVPPEKASINLRLDYLLRRWGQSFAKITATEKDNLDIISIELPEINKILITLGEDKLKKIEDQLDKVGAPWTPGRVPKID